MDGRGGSERDSWWGRKVARLPATGVLLFATDLQGNMGDFRALEAIYFAEKEAGNEPILLFCGDLVHGPGGRLADPSRWPDYLGSYYEDRSAELILAFLELSERERVLSLLGNHEHAHIGGPTVSKFHDDEAAVLDEKLGDDAPRVQAFMRGFPLMAVAPCGGVFTHGAPRGTEPDLEAFERLSYDGYDDVSIQSMYEVDTVGALLWSRHADPDRARALLRAATLEGRPSTFVAYGHDVVREGFEKIGEEQLCLSTSFGCEDQHKYYLRLELDRRYRSVQDLRLGREILRLHPDAEDQSVSG